MNTRSDITVQRVTGNIGAVVGGIDISRPIEPQAIQEVRRALLDHGVIFLRDQDINAEQYWGFIEEFGIPEKDESFGSSKDTAKDLNTSDFSGARYATNIWHADTTALAKPPIATALRAVEVPPFGGDTCWSSMYAAWDALTEPMKRMLDGLTAIHSIVPTFDRTKVGNPIYMEAFTKVHPLQSVHPVILEHPETGRKALYVSETFTTRIVELDRIESDYILSFLFRHIEKPDFVCRWKWQANDLALWDNRSTQHYAVPDYASTRRMQRITLAGARPGERSEFRARSTIAA